MKKLTLLFVVLFFTIIIKSQIIFSDTTGIMIETTLDTYWLNNNYHSDLLKMKEAGVDVVRVNIENEARINKIKATYNLNVIPIRTIGLNWIQHYTDAKYSVWEAEGVLPEFTEVNLVYDTLALTMIPEYDSLKYMKLIPDYAGSVRTLIAGPYYNQDVYYYTAQIDTADKTVRYTASYKLKLEHNPQINPLPPDNFSDTLCILQVTQSKIETSPDWHLSCTFVIDTLYLKRSDFDSLGKFKEFNIVYNLLKKDCNGSKFDEPQMPNAFSTSRFGEEVPGPRDSRDYIQFKVIWQGNPNYLISIDKIVVADDRGSELKNSDSDAEDNILLQVNSLNTYNDILEGWLGIDEPLSLDVFEPIRLVKELIETQSTYPRPLIVPFMGHWNSTWNQPENIFGCYGKSPWVEYGKRVGASNIIQNYYMYDEPCNENSTWDICGDDWKSANIFVTAELNFKQAYLLDNNFGISMQCGYLKHDQANEREVEPHEILYNSNLALMYGAKYLSLFTYFAQTSIENCTSGQTCSGIVNIDGDSLVYTDKYFMLRDTLSPRLKGLFGKTLKKLVPDTSKILGKDILVHPDYSSSSTYIDYIESVGSESDTCVIDLGFFTDPADNSVDYFMPINRYYSTLNYLTFGLKNLSEYSNWKITDFVDTTQFTALSVNGLTEYTDTITPGDAKLYSVAPVVKYGGLLAYNDTIKTNTTLSDNMTIDADKVLQINEGKTYTITDTITFTDTSSFITGYGYINRTQNGWVTTRSWSRSLFKGRSGSHPKLIWSKHPEITNVIEYKIYRNYASEGWQYLTTKSSSTFEYIDSTITIIEGMPQANETSTQYRVTATYRPSKLVIETSPSNTILYHRVEGQGLEKQNSGLTGNDFTYNLDQNYPNPFNPTTTISYSIADDGIVTLEIMNILGERIKTLVNEFKTRGNHNISFNASSLASGVYVYKLQAGDFVRSKKMILLK